MLSRCGYCNSVVGFECLALWLLHTRPSLGFSVNEYVSQSAWLFRRYVVSVVLVSVLFSFFWLRTLEVALVRVALRFVVVCLVRTLDDANERKIGSFQTRAQMTPVSCREDGELSSPSFAGKLGPVFLLYSGSLLAPFPLPVLSYNGSHSPRNLRQSPDSLAAPLFPPRDFVHRQTACIHQHSSRHPGSHRYLAPLSTLHHARPSHCPPNATQ